MFSLNLGQSHVSQRQFFEKDECYVGSLDSFERAYQLKEDIEHHLKRGTDNNRLQHYIFNANQDLEFLKGETGPEARKARRTLRQCIKMAESELNQ